MPTSAAGAVGRVYLRTIKMAALTLAYLIFHSYIYSHFLKEYKVYSFPFFVMVGWVPVISKSYLFLK